MNNDLISREAALNIIRRQMQEEGIDDEALAELEVLECEFEDLPAVDAEPVRHGAWINHFDDLFPEESYQECSECHAETNGYLLEDDFCPKCGAKMDKTKAGE